MSANVSRPRDNGHTGTLLERRRREGARRRSDGLPGVAEAICVVGVVGVDGDRGLLFNETDKPC